MKKIAALEWRDVGVIIALILILSGLTQHSILYYKITCGVLLLLLLQPILFRPAAIIWFKIGHWLSKISSGFILSIAYAIILLQAHLFEK